MNMKRRNIGRWLCILLFAGCITGNAVTAGASESTTPYNYAEQAEAYLNVIGTEYPNRSLISEDAQENDREAFISWLLGELKDAGYTEEDIEEDSFPVYGQEDLTGTNITVTLQGRDSSREVIAAAHFDGDGVGDNASGVALLLANACGLVDEIPDTTVRFLFLDGEEEGNLGSYYYVEQMTDAEIESTVYMINVDSIAFGDYCNVYGGETELSGETILTSGYEIAMERAEQMGFQTYRTEDLDGYYELHQCGPEPQENTLYTNPWTIANPSPENFDYPSPTTGGWGDHAAFSEMGIPYIYFEATNWYTDGDGGEYAYTGYFDTEDKSLGYFGMIMNTEFDTLEYLNQYFPGRARAHFELYSPLLSSLVLQYVSK